MPFISTNRNTIKKLNVLIELWFSKKDPNETSDLPSRPAKLTPIFARKRGEITQIEDDQSKNYNQEIKDDDQVEQQDKTKKKKKLDVINTQKNGNVQEIPSNQFDFIWDTNNLMPKLENDVNGLGTISEEFSDLRLNRNKTNLGGRVSKSSHEENKPANLNDSSQMNIFSNFDNEPKVDLNVSDENKKSTKKKKKDKEKEKVGSAGHKIKRVKSKNKSFDDDEDYSKQEDLNEFKFINGHNLSIYNNANNNIQNGDLLTFTPPNNLTEIDSTSVSVA